MYIELVLGFSFYLLFYIFFIMTDIYKVTVKVHGEVCLSSHKLSIIFVQFQSKLDFRISPPTLNLMDICLVRVFHLS